MTRVSDSGPDASRPEPDTATVPELPVDAPWLTESRGWSIIEVLASELRADVFVYSELSQAFRRVVRVSITGAGGQRMVYCDLADGRTLRFDPDAQVVARQRF